MVDSARLASAIRSLGPSNPAAHLKLHSELRKAVAANPHAATESVMRGAIRLNERLHSFLVELEADRRSRQHSQQASLMELASIGGLVLQDFMGNSEQRSIPRLMLGSVAGGLAYLGTREYVKGGDAVIDGLLARAGLWLAEETWSLLEDTGNPPADSELQQVCDTLLALGAALADPGYPAARRASVVVSLANEILLARVERADSGPRHRK